MEDSEKRYLNYVLSLLLSTVAFLFLAISFVIIAIKPAPISTCIFSTLANGFLLASSITGFYGISRSFKFDQKYVNGVYSLQAIMGAVGIVLLILTWTFTNMFN